MTPSPFPCCLEGPAAWLPQARYALQMLLQPLGLAPTWVPREDLHSTGLYYGPTPDGLGDAVWTMPVQEATLAYFAHRRPYPPTNVAWSTWDGTQVPVLFALADGTPDLIAGAFFWLSGWQEWTNPVRDRHGRFPYAASLQKAWGVVDVPVVDAYRELLAEALLARGVALNRRTWHGKSWALCPTHDVDYLRKWRPGILYRETVPYFLRNARREPLGTRTRRLGRAVQDWLTPGDPYRTSLERMQAEVEKRGATATYFLKAGAHEPYDVPYPLHRGYMHRRLLDLQSKGFEIGLHPSYFAYAHPGYMQQEAAHLAEVMGTAPTAVRQHYLCFEAPTTPRLQAGAGFEVDSTLGFAMQEGFRFGTCHPFQLFDIPRNAPLPLWEMPLLLMETTLFNRRHLTVDEAIAQTRTLLHTCRRFGGVCVTLWHNIIYDPLDAPGWHRHFEATLDDALELGAFVGSLQAARAG